MTSPQVEIHFSDGVIHVLGRGNPHLPLIGTTGAKIVRGDDGTEWHVKGVNWSVKWGNLEKITIDCEPASARFFESKIALEHQNANRKAPK